MAIIVALQKTELAQNIASLLNKDLIILQKQTFSDGECKVKLEDWQQFQNKIVVIVQSASKPVNDSILSLAFLIHELKNAGAKKIIAVIPYLAYARHEKSYMPEKRGTVAVIINMLESAGADEIITVELHEPSIMKYFSVPVYNVSMIETIADHIKKNNPRLLGVCLVAPDEGAQSYVQAVGKILGLGVIVFAKERYGKNKTRIVGMRGACRGKKAILIDDIIDTGGTAISVANKLTSLGFESVEGYFVHPVLSAHAPQKVQESLFAKIYVCNTLELPQENNKINVLDISSVLAKSIEKQCKKLNQQTSKQLSG